MARDSNQPFRNDGGQAEDDFGLPPIGPVASQGQLPPPPAAPVNERDRIPVHHHLAPQPPSPSQQSAVSPMAHESASTEYFPSLPVPANNLSTAQSQTSMRNRRSSRGSASSGSAFRDPPPPTAIPRQPSIRIRRRGGSGSSNRSSLLEPQAVAGSSGTYAGPSSSAGRARSSSQPERPNAQQHLQNIARHSRTPHAAMPRLTEEGNRPTMEELGMANQPPLESTWSLPEQTHSNEEVPATATTADAPRHGPLRRMSRMFWTRRPQSASSSGQPQPEVSDLQRTNMASDEYDAAVVDYLDTIDPEVQALTALTNVQNSLFVPDLGKWLNRRPTYTLSDYDFDEKFLRRAPSRLTQAPAEGTIPEATKEQEQIAEATDTADERPDLQRLSTIASHITPAHYAALPHGTTLEGWTEDEKWELDDYVRHMMHSRRSKFKRSMKGFGQYVRRPLGFFVTLYATLITLFGLAWVLFLIGWIYIDNRQDYIIHVIDSVLVALFAIMGDGLAPFRAIDTYHMIWVLRYAHIIKMAQRKERKAAEKREREKLQEEAEICPSANQTPSANDIDNADLQLGEEPHRSNSYTMANNIVDAEDARSGIEAYENTPLTPAQMKKLHHHQSKLAKSHSFYKPNETATHYAYPLNYLIAIVVLLDCHSCLQISLGATTWGIDYKTRPIAITTVILCVSIACNISAGIVITMGGKKTRKKDVWERMTRQELTSLAIKKVEENRNKEAEELEAKRQHKKEVREKKDREKGIAPETGLELGSGSNSHST